jgi:membrane-associated phospholipid phosphatase
MRDAARPGLRPIDLLILAYLLVASVVVATRLERQPGGWWLLGAHLLIVGLIALLARPGLGRLGRAVREVYPLVLLVGLYSALDVMNGGGAAHVHDATVQRWEAALFGGQPSRDWWSAHPSGFWSLVLHGAYLAYYFIVAAPAVVFAARRQLPALRGYVLAVIVAFLTCYLFFILFPVAGPYYAFPRPTGPFVQNVTARLVYATLAVGSSYGAAFPSSHVAASGAATGASFRGSRALGLALLPLTGLLVVSVVYCQMHYAVDALAGLVVGVGALATAARFHA